MVYDLSYLMNFKIFLVAILLYVIIYTLLKKMEIFGDDKNVTALISFISVIIVSLTGVLTYAVAYALNLFILIIFILFLIFLLANFTGVKLSDIYSISKSNSKAILIAFLVIFSIIFLKSFFAVNNTYDISNPQNDSYAINTSLNTGVDDMVDTKKVESFFGRLNIDSDILSSVLFLITIGVFVIIIGK